MAWSLACAATISRWMPASTSFASARVRPKSAMSTRPSGRLISTTSAHDPSPSAPISTSLKTQATYPPSVRERARKYPTAVAPPISRRSPINSLGQGVAAHHDAPLRLPPAAITEYAVVLTVDSIVARSTRRRQTATGWNTAYIGANRYTLASDETLPDDDALYPMAFLVEKGPGAVTRPHFHQADQFQVVVAGRGMLGDHEFSDGAEHYTDAYSAYGPIVTGKSGIWWFTLRNRWDPGARYMPAEREVLHVARNRYQHWELTTEAVPAALVAELCEATASSCRSVLE